MVCQRDKQIALFTISRKHWNRTCTCPFLHTPTLDLQKGKALSAPTKRKKISYTVIIVIQLGKQRTLVESMGFTFFLARSWQPVKFSGNLQVPN